jgi:AraC-like DNA-binding protein
MDAGTRLWLPPLTLRGCVRAAFVRDTRGRALGDEQRRNYFPAAPLVSLVWWLHGQVFGVGAEGFMGEPGQAAPVPGSVTLAGPSSLPSQSRSDGPVHALQLMFLPDAWLALTGIEPGDFVNRLTDAATVLPADWLAWTAAVAAAPDDAAREQLLVGFLEPRWLALRQQRPLGERYADWLGALAVRAATSGVGRSLRQAERRVKAWAGMPMRELRALSRSEAAFFAVVAAETAKDGSTLNWAQLAADLDYADQSHLCRETKRLTGFSPDELRRRIASDESFWVYRLWL